MIIKKKQNKNARTKEDEFQTPEERSAVIIPKKALDHPNLSTTIKSSKSGLKTPIINADRNIQQADQSATSTDDTDGNLDDFKKDKSKQSDLVKKGPIRAHSSIRMTNVFDYKPDICKDYFETGFCGYGDNCKFAHIREDYQKGWEIDRDYEEKKRQQRNGESEDVKIEEDALPFACHLCRQDFVNPVVTRCKHYFCEECAVKHYNGGKAPRCAVCQSDTGGIFNTAHEILKRKKKKMESQVTTQ